MRDSTYYGQGSGQIYGYHCGLFDNSLSSCSILSYYSLAGCHHYLDVGIECEG